MTLFGTAAVELLFNWELKTWKSYCSLESTNDSLAEQLSMRGFTAHGLSTR